ncbi:MAG: tetratricopeptide repeat protein [Verrucomicrobiota bacterium]
MTLPFPDPKLSGFGVAKAGPRFALELFVILCLSVCYYFLVRNFALGVGNNYTNNWVFTACARTTYHLDDLYEWWKGRLAGTLLSGSLFGLIVRDDGYQITTYAMLFGLYQAFWLLVLMLTMLVAVRESLLVNLCIFAGLIYNCMPGAGLYFYPWDLPATVFLTLAVLLHARGHRVLMLGAVCVGCFFKETVLVGVVLCLFNREWKWRWRLLGFAGPLAFYFLVEHWLFGAFHLKTSVMATRDIASLGRLAHPEFFVRNLKLIFSDITPQVFFANGGTLVAVLLLGWEKRFRPYLLMIVAFVAGHYLRGLTLDIWQGMFSEVRVLTQVLPVSCLILSEYGQSWIQRSADASQRRLEPGSGREQPDRSGKRRENAPKPVAEKIVPARSEDAWACRTSDKGLIRVAVAVMVISGIAVAWDCYALLQSRHPEYQARLLAELGAKAERGDIAAQYRLGNRFYRGLGVATNWQEAFSWYQEAAGQGHPGAELALGLRYLRGEGTAQSYEASIPWFRKVADLNNQAVQCYFELEYGEGFGAKQDLVEHFQYLAWVGPLALAAAGLGILMGVIFKRKSFFDPALCVAVVLAAGALSWRWRDGGPEPLWRNIVTCDPNYCLAERNLGNALLKTGQEGKALACFQKAVEFDPDDAGAHFNIGNILFKNGRLDEAIAHFQKAVESWPDNAAMHNNLGYALVSRGRFDEAISQYREALRLKPDLAEASNNLAAALSLKEAGMKQAAPSTKP